MVTLRSQMWRTNLQHGCTFEVTDFLVGQQIKVSQHMAEEHAEMQMIQRALVGTTERQYERALDKIRANAECRRRMNQHQTPTPQRNPGRSPPGTRHGQKQRQGHGN